MLRAGKDIVPMALLGVSEKSLSAGEVGELLGISRNMVGRIASQNNLKIPAYGEWVLGQSEYNGTQRQTFIYNSAGVAKIREFIDSANQSGKEAA